MGNARLERRPEARAFSVEALLQHVRDGKIRVPDFQRPLRWRANHVLDLLDSVYRGFPVGDLLLSKQAADAAAIHLGPVHVHAEAMPDAYFVVDGQQRITALAGAMLHPEPRPRGDIYAVWFDLEEERFARGTYREPPAHWIPLNVVGDSFALLTWLNAWPFRSQRPDLVQRAIGLGKALREYQIPAYIVEGASDEVLRLIFKRVNTSVVAMQETEVFAALFGGGEPHPIESACARLQTATGFGDISPDLFLGCLKVIEGLQVANELTEGQVAKLDPLAVERTENALLRALRFLQDDAGIPHFKLLPYPLPLVVLARFFHLHARPAQRTRALLSRWMWRGALNLSDENQHSDIGSMQLASRRLDGDEFASAERLLESVPARRSFVPLASATWSTAEHAALRVAGGHAVAPESQYDRLCALALVHLGPRDPDTGAVLGSDEIRALLELNPVGYVFLDVGDVFDVERLVASTVAGRVLVSSYDKIEKLPSAPLSVLESHGIDQQAADALGRRDLATFTQRREAILDRWFKRFFADRIGEGDNDRPPVAELIRRVDKALTAA
jgi:Protein of unknown function DUF262